MMKSLICHLAWVLFIFLGPISVSSAQVSQIVPGSATDRFALLGPLMEEFGLVASVDPRGRNNDGFFGGHLLSLPMFNGEDDKHWAYTRPDTWVLFHEKGQPGTLTHLFKTFYSEVTSLFLFEVETYDIDIYIDDMVTPAHTLDVKDLFSGAVAPFTGPPVWVTGGGHNSHTTLSWDEEIKVVARRWSPAGLPSADGPRFYKVGFTRGTSGPDVADWAETLDLKGSYPHSLPAQTSGTVTRDLAPGSDVRALRVSGPGLLYAMVFRVDSVSAWRDVRIETYWEGEETPSVSVPLGMFCGTSGPVYPIRSLFFGMDGDRIGWNYFPQPHRTLAEVRLVNRSSASHTVEMAWSYTAGAYPEPFGHLYAQYREEKPTRTGFDYVAADIRDQQGKVAAVVLEHEVDRSDPSGNSPHNPGDRSDHLEGDGREYADGKRTPAHDSATEVFFNWAFYGLRTDRPFSLPTVGNSGPEPVTSPFRGVARSMYRIFAVDRRTFHRDYRLQFEHGPENDANAWYRSATFYYGTRPGSPAMELVDRVDSGDEGSRSWHAYGVMGMPPQALSLTSRYMGDMMSLPFIDDGYAIGSGSVEFEVHVPPDNEGVRLLTRFDWGFRHGPKEAMVTIDGESAGSFFESGSNVYDRFTDVSLNIPPALTAGKSRITVRVTPIDGARWADLDTRVMAFRTAGSDERRFGTSTSLYGPITAGRWARPGSPVVFYASNAPAGASAILRAGTRSLPGEQTADPARLYVDPRGPFEEHLCLVGPDRTVTLPVLCLSEAITEAPRYFIQFVFPGAGPNGTDLASRGVEFRN